MCSSSSLLLITFIGVYAYGTSAEAKSIGRKPRRQATNEILQEHQDLNEFASLFSPTALERRRASSKEHEDGKHDEHDGEEDNDERERGRLWGSVIGATLLVNLVTLSGIIFLIPIFARHTNDSHMSSAATLWRSMFWKTEQEIHVNNCCDESDRRKRSKKSFDIAIPSFAAGALLATVLFLVLPEAIYHIHISLLAEEHSHEEEEEEGDEHGYEHESEGEILPGTIWRFGTAVLGGFLLPLLLSALFPRSLEHTCDDDCGEALEEDAFGTFLNSASTTVTPRAFPMPLSEEDVTEDCCGCSEDHHVIVAHEEQNSNDCARHEHELKCSSQHNQEPPKRNDIEWSLALSILLGDSFHNFCDGVFIGVAFKLCSASTAFTIVGITIYHEVAQELADFFLLTKHAGLTSGWALLLNFLAGLTVVLGGIIPLAVDVGDGVIGIILSIAAGVYLHIAASECLPRVNAIVTTSKDRIISFAMFVVGAVPIGLTLINHTHCSAEH